MGAQATQPQDGSHGRHSMRLVLRDLDALEQMLGTGSFETGIRRIGAEQELVLVNESYQPAPVSVEVLERITDPRVVPEIARFNLEMNCSPVELRGLCFSSLEQQLVELYGIVEQAAAQEGATPLLAGICPTVELSDLSRANMVPKDRYTRLDGVLKQMRGADFELCIEGADDLYVSHPTVMLEAVNTSFQVHYQVDPAIFASVYNVAMAVAAPVLAAAVNSPILFGKRLWRETRIAIFQQVVDTRGASAGRRDLLGRVRFGEKWVESSVLEIFRADVARFRQVVAASSDVASDPFEDIEAGRAPKLAALQTFNSCMYRWMRPCYGITDGKPHLRIENRALPAGPTIEDEVANSAFWIGLLSAGPTEWPDLTSRLDFKESRANFMKAAREGLSCHFTWLDNVEVPASELIPKVLIPVARRGLEAEGVDRADIDRTLSVIERRVSSRQTGANWALNSVAKLHGKGTRAERLSRLTRAMVENQRSGKPVHEWPIVETKEDHSLSSAYSTVSQCMTTDLFTVQEDECIDLVASIMDWERLRHVPVEDGSRRLVGLVSYRSLIRSLVKRRADEYEHPVAVRAIMVSDPITTTPDTPTLEAIRIMRDNKISCLPVVEEGRLVGIISERDYTRIAGHLLEEALRRGQLPCP